MILLLVPALSSSQSQRYAQFFPGDFREAYRDQKSWDRDLVASRSEIFSMKARDRKPINSSGQLKDALEAMYALRARVGNMARWAALAGYVDKTSDIARERYVAATELETQSESAIAPVEYQIRLMGKAKANDFAAHDRMLQVYRIRLNRIFRLAPYTARPDIQSVVTLLAQWPNAFGDTYDSVMASNLAWPTITDNSGRERTLDPDTFEELRRSPDADLRARAHAIYLKHLKHLEVPLGVMFVRGMQGEYEATSRTNLKNSVNAAYVLRDGNPDGSYRRIFETARAGRQTLIRYARFMSQSGGSPKPSLSDLLASPPAFDLKFAMPQVVDTLIRATAPLGEDYQQRLRFVSGQQWGAFTPSRDRTDDIGVWWQIGGGHPFGLVSFDGTLGNARIYASVLASLVKDSGMTTEQIPDTRLDPAISGNAVFYGTGLLFIRQLAEETNDPHVRRALQQAELSQLYRLYFQYAITTEFEARVSEMVAHGDAPTGAQLSAIWGELLRDYYGGVDGVEVDKLFETMWMTYPLMFRSHEQMFWPAAVSASILLVDGISKHDPRAKSLMMNEFAGGYSDFGYDILKRAGVDVSTDVPFMAVQQRMNGLMDALETKN
jgi:oligoendopeptidase F